MKNRDARVALERIAGESTDGRGVRFEPVVQEANREAYQIIFAGLDDSPAGKWVDFHVQPTTQTVTLARFSAVVGIIADEEGFRDALQMNQNGVNDSEFYFSSLVRNGRHLLLLETKASLEDRSASEFVEILRGWIMHPLFTRTWKFPPKVANLLWEE